MDGARDLYLLALALGARKDQAKPFGHMIREARTNFAAVLEEARIAGLDTSALGAMQGTQSKKLADSIRPELWQRVEELVAHRAGRGPNRSARTLCADGLLGRQ